MSFALDVVQKLRSTGYWPFISIQLLSDFCIEVCAEGYHPLLYTF